MLPGNDVVCVEEGPGLAPSVLAVAVAHLQEVALSSAGSWLPRGCIDRSTCGIVHQGSNGRLAQDGAELGIRHR